MLLPHFAHLTLLYSPDPHTPPSASFPPVDNPRMLAKFIITSAALALGVTALQVTAPTNATGWTTDGAQVIKWDVSDS